MTAALVVLVFTLAVVVAGHLVAARGWAAERRDLVNRVIARHAPEVAALDQVKARRNGKPHRDSDGDARREPIVPIGT